MRRPRLLRSGMAAAVVAVALPLAVGHASSLSAGSKALGAKGTAIASCDTAGFTTLPNLTTGSIVSVTVGSIAAACATGSLSVNVNNGTTNSSGTIAVPAGGGSVTVTLAVAVLAKDAEQIDVAISGP